MNNVAKKSDERRATRAHLIAVYNRLLLDDTRTRPKVADLIAEAGLARSTFYDYFDGIVALHDESLSIILRRLAAALTDPGANRVLKDLLSHIWENRSRARAILTGDAGERAEAQLARYVEKDIPLGPDRRLNALLASGMAMTALGGWLGGRIAASPIHLANRLQASAMAIIGRATGLKEVIATNSQ